MGDSRLQVEERLGRSSDVSVVADDSNQIRILEIQEGVEVGEILPGISLGMTKEAVWNRLVELGICTSGPDTQDFGVFREGHQ